jgi:ribosomal protein S12 methylthiotransferase accessory factor YcaO
MNATPETETAAIAAVLTRADMPAIASAHALRRLPIPFPAQAARVFEWNMPYRA